MTMHKSIEEVKQALQKNVGQSIRLTSSKGRRKPVVRHGIIEQTFPSIFVVKLDAPKGQEEGISRLSYSYADVLTKSIEMVLI